MVQALIEGRKTKTRRIIKPQPYPAQNDPLGIPGANSDDFAWPTKHSCSIIISSKKNGPDDYVKEMSKWQAGDLLYVKETHYAYGYWKKNGKTKTGKQKWRFIHDQLFGIRFTKPPCRIEKNSFRAPAWYKRSALFMPKEAARIWLEVTGVRVERLQDISEQDAKAEGADRGIIRQGPNTSKGEFHLEYNCMAKHKTGFEFIWKVINGIESWQQNPFVWVIEFKVLSTTGKPQHLEIKNS